MTSPLSAQPGAVAPPDNSADPGVAWHYGDPLREQRSADREVVVVDRSHRPVLAVTGEDRLGWLHTITSQHLTELDDGAHTEALVLDGQGRVEHHAVLSNVDGTVWLDTEPGRADGLLRYLTQMVFWSKVAPRDASAQRAVLSLLGPSTGQLLAEAGPALTERGVIVRSTTADRGVAGADLLVDREHLVDTWTLLTTRGAAPAGTWAYEALRVASLRARLGVDTDDRTIPHEAGWIGTAVHLDKGCYRGQETVARVANLGRSPRRLLLLHLESGDLLPAVGDPLLAGERTVGRVGTVVNHHELGAVALALVKRSVEPGTALRAGAGEDAPSAAIDPDSVPPDTGEPPGRAALRRLRA